MPMMNTMNGIPKELEGKPWPGTGNEDLELVVANLVKEALSNPANWPHGLPATPNFPCSLSTPPLDSLELERRLDQAAGNRVQSVHSGIEDTRRPDNPERNIESPSDTGRTNVATTDGSLEYQKLEPDMNQLKSLLEKLLGELPFQQRTNAVGSSRSGEGPKPYTRSRASKDEYKIISEIWDKEESRYKTAESAEAEDILDDLDEYIFVIRKRVDRKSSETTTFVDVKSEHLRDALREVLQSVRSSSLMEDKPSIEQSTLFHFLPELNHYMQAMHVADDSDTKKAKHLNLLVSYVENASAPISQRVKSLLQHRQITYDLLWALFKPGALVYSTCLGSGKPRCVIFDAGEDAVYEGITYYKMECRYLDFDGREFGEADVTLGIEKFRGAKPIASLEAFPFQLHPDREEMRQSLIKRGQRFCQLTSTHVQHCGGTAFIMKDGKPVRLNINSRVAVDAAFFREMQPNYSRPRIQDLWQGASSGWKVIDLDSIVGRDGTGRTRKRGLEAQQLTDEEFLICCPTVCCFSFKEKMFMECAVADLANVEWSPEMFSCLKIPEETKKMLVSLARTRLGSIQTVPFDDFVEGKGRGINVLLHGNTGTGKTFTVEATAELFKLPLYSISAGELITDHGDLHVLERQLDSIFKVAKHFNAVLLLDEADAFMERRTSFLDAHNRLLTVFLRKLEYYNGILFLTTNRAIEFDDAILSRIHLKIRYEGLTKESRRDIWVHFLSKARTSEGPSVVGSDELQHLASISLNGREIKNIISIAHALATADKQQVTYRYLEAAAKSNEKSAKEFSAPEHLESIYT